MICFKKVQISEIDKVWLITKAVVAHMKSIGFTQWNEDYPTLDVLLEDINLGNLYGAYIKDVLTGFVALNNNQAKEYTDIPFKFDEPCLVVHRLQVDPLYRGMHIGHDLMIHAQHIAKQKNCKSIRLDTRYDNIAAMSLYKNLGYKRRGHVHFARMIEYVFPCFEKEIK